MANEEEIGFGLVALLLALFAGDGDGDEETTETVYIPPGTPAQPKETVFIPPKPTETELVPGLFPPEQEEETKIPLIEIVDSYPRPATFYPVQKGNNGYGIAYGYLRSAGYLAGQRYGELDNAAANFFGSQVAKKVQRQVKVWRGIQCNGWNDAFYGTYGWRQLAAAPPHGRAIRLVPQHTDILEALASGDTPMRNMKWKNKASKGKGGGVGANNQYREYETLWLPGLNLKKLWDSDGKTIEFGGGVWPGPDRISKIFPPPWVLKLGIAWTSGAGPNTAEFGCDGMEMEF